MSHNGNGSDGRDNMYMEFCDSSLEDVEKDQLWTISDGGKIKPFTNIIGGEYNKCIVVDSIEKGANLYVVEDCGSVDGDLKKWTYNSSDGTIRLESKPSFCVSKGTSDRFTDHRKERGVVLRKCDGEEDQIFDSVHATPPAYWLPDNVIPAPTPGDDDDDDDDGSGGSPVVLPNYFVSFGGAGGCIAHNGNGSSGRDNMFMEGCDLEEMEKDQLWTINDAGMLKPFANMIGGKHNKCVVIPDADTIKEGTNLYVVEDCSSVKGDFKKWTYNAKNDGSIRLLSDPTLCVSKGRSDKFNDWREDEGVVLRKCDGKKDQMFENVDVVPPSSWLPDGLIPAPVPGDDDDDDGDDDDDDDDDGSGGSPVLPQYFIFSSGDGGCIAHNGNGSDGRDNMYMEGWDLEELEKDQLWTISDGGKIKPFTNMIGGAYNKCIVVDAIEKGSNLYVVEDCGSVDGDFKKWTFNSNDGTIRLASNPSFCVSKGTSDKFTDWRKEEGVVLRKCDGEKDQTFENVDVKPNPYWLPDAGRL